MSAEAARKAKWKKQMKQKSLVNRVVLEKTAMLINESANIPRDVTVRLRGMISQLFSLQDKIDKEVEAA